MKIVKPYWIKHSDKQLGTDSSIFSIDIHPEGTKVATGGLGNDCGRVAIWNIAPIISTDDESNKNVPKLLCQIDSHLQCVNAVRWSNSGNFLASAGDDQLIMIWTLGGRYQGPGPTEQYRIVATLRSHSGDILHLDWSHDDQYLASCSVDNMIVVWNTQRWPEITATLKGHSGLVKGISWDPIGKYLASQSDDKTLKIWKVSDWSEEIEIKDPFVQCGGTTHFLRLSWSPDGQYLVSAQAMNNCGSVAKIINRQDWSFERDFAGHRKAIPCVNFNSNIFKYPVKKKDNDNKEQKFRRHCVLAVGSRDRSISIWTTSRARPLLVISGIFENSVLDFSWSKTGYQLMACSLDGTVAFIQFTAKELGLIYTPDERVEYLQQLYGNNVGNKNSTFNHLIEDMDIMMLQSQKNGIIDKESTSGQEPTEFKSNSSSSTPNSKSAQRLAKGPTDKQIEIRSADGRRRIIPLFIPPSNEPVLSTNDSPTAIPSSANGVLQPLTFSSSRECKSKIVIETRDESNSSAGYQSYYNSQFSNTLAHANKKPEEMTNQLTAFIEPNKQPRISESKGMTEEQNKAQINSISNGINNNNESSDESSEEDNLKKRNRVTGIKRKSIDNSLTLKRKPGRPPGTINQPVLKDPKQVSNEIQSKSHQSELNNMKSLPNIMDISTNPRQSVSKLAVAPDIQPTILSKSVNSSQTFVFPPIRLSRQSQQNVKLFSENNKIYTANIEYPMSSSSLCKLSLLIDNQTNWTILLSSTVLAISANEHNLVCACEDRTVSIFNIKTGRRFHVPIILDSLVARMVCCNTSHLLLITCNANLWLWDILIPKVLVKGESLSPLLSHPKKLDQLSITNASVSSSAKPIVTVSNGRTYIYENDFSSWCLVADQNDPLNACTDLKPCPVNGLRSSSTHSIPSRSLLNFFISNTSTAQHGLISFIEQQIEAAKLLGSSKDYRYWTMSLAQNLVSLHSSGFNSENNEIRLRELCTFLLGKKFPNFKDVSTVMSSTANISSTPLLNIAKRDISGSNERNTNKILGFNKHELLREVLAVLSTNLSLQRLYIEFKEQLESFTKFNSSTYLNTSKISNESPSINCNS